ncbi:DUF6913 domain-containing protein [Cellulophaga baltica]|uniref:DUF6913 domain-containing protein n=1 Tax=Cellulophaga baltica TaxID=76594 RepID=UPI0015F3B5E2|nr:hypothetical protein [Cellulophaga baltica]MBA6315485.1 hypothetical protein [Cellulophaga baltica]
MFLKALKQKLKLKSARKHVKQLLSGPLENVKKGHGIASVGCIVDLDQFEDASLFYQLVDEFKLRPNSVKIIGYKNFYDKNSPYATPIFSDKDLGWNGAIENGYALEFFSREYDLLLNYYSEEQLLLQLMTLKTKARIRVGFGSVDHKLNDLILQTPISNFGLFKEELKKYLKIFKEIE